MARRVLWVIKGLGPGGAERLLAEAAGAIGGGVELTCAFVMAAKAHLVPVLEAAGVRCVCVSRRARDPLWPLRLAGLVRGGGWDVVHVHAPLPGSVARLAARSLRRSHRPVLLTTEHNAWGTYRLPTRALNALTSRWDCHTFAVSDEAARSVRGRVAERVSVLTHGLDVAAVRARLGERDRMRAELGIAGGTLVVGTVANFREQKDYPNLLEACALLIARDVPFVLVAVGQGPLERDVRGLHERLGLGERVRLLGYRPDAIDVLAACDVFVLASAYEGLPVALMEACALGLPAVLTDVGGMRAALGDGGARWVPPASAAVLADALEEVLTDAASRGRLAAAAAAASPCFDRGEAIAQLRRWYLSGAPPAAVAPPAGGEVTLRPATPDDLPQILELCRRSLGWDESGDWEGLYRWKHLDNPFGASPAWVAAVESAGGERLVGLRVFLRWQFVRDGAVVHAVRAVDTATDPDFRGRGLFTALTLGALPALRAEGVELVFNTPNDQSRPGYVKMGWQPVGTLRPVLRPVGLGSVPRLVRSRVPAALWPEPLSVGRSVEDWLAADGRALLSGRSAGDGLRTAVDEAFARWRFGAALQPCRVIGADGTVAVVQVRARGAARELVCLCAWGAARDVDALLIAAARAAGADVVLRLGAPSIRRGFVGVRALGPRLTCLMLADAPVPPLAHWQLTMGDVALF